MHTGSIAARQLMLPRSKAAGTRMPPSKLAVWDFNLTKLYTPESQQLKKEGRQVGLVVERH
jgi:hypothetical protein